MAELLTADEKQCIELCAQVVTVFNRVVAWGPTREADMAEFVFHIHAIQRMIGSQAGARAYPTEYRLLGDTIGWDQQ